MAAVSEQPNRGLSRAEAAERLGIGITLVKSLIKNGQLPEVRLGARSVVPSTAVDAILSGGTRTSGDGQ